MWFLSKIKINFPAILDLLFWFPAPSQPSKFGKLHHKWPNLTRVMYHRDPSWHGPDLIEYPALHFQSLCWFAPKIYFQTNKLKVAMKKSMPWVFFEWTFQLVLSWEMNGIFNVKTRYSAIVKKETVFLKTSLLEWITLEKQNSSVIAMRWANNELCQRTCK